MKHPCHTFTALLVLVVGVGVGCAPADVGDIVQRLALKEGEVSARAPGVGDVVGLHDALQGHCVGDDVPATPPALPPLPETLDPLPDRCDVERRLGAVVEVCGPLQASVVDTGDLSARAAGCAGDTTCLITLPPGRYAGRQTLGCVVLQGEGEADDVIVDGALSFSSPSIVQGLRVEDDYGAVSTTADLLVTDAILVGGYEGLGLSWDQVIDVAVCRTRVAAGYVGISQSWGSRRVTVAGSGIAACYEATSANWGSSLQLVTQSLLLSHHTGASIHQSPGVAVIGNVIAGTVSAVDIYAVDNLGDDPYEPDVRDILVRGNVALRGQMPASDAARNIIVE